ncbi:MAG: protein kinase [Labilithrix sp.]|nr:protein kinase [Labilithrix sp.]
MSARRYEPLVKIGSGGTAEVFVGTAAGALGFTQLVAIKRPHTHLADDAAFRDALVVEAKIAAKLRHANVVDVRDVEADDDGIQLVMDYVEGASLSDVIRSWVKAPPPRAAAVAIRIVLDACAGLRAVHELTSDDGEPLGLVHRDVSPANILVGVDGVARITDFGLAKPLLQIESRTSEGALRGKLGYMAPEYIRGRSIDRRIDVFAMGVVLWEVLARKRLFRGENDADTLERVQKIEAPKLEEVAGDLALGAATALDDVLRHALAKEPDARFSTVDELVKKLEKVAKDHELAATHADVRESFGAALEQMLEERKKKIAAASVPPASASPASVKPASVKPASVRPSRARVAIGAAFAVAIAIGAALIVTRESASARAPGAIHEVAHDVQPKAGEPRGRAAPDEPSAHPPKGRPAVKPRAEDTSPPGFKAPRPNPYASGASPR